MGTIVLVGSESERIHNLLKASLIERDTLKNKIVDSPLGNKTIKGLNEAIEKLQEELNNTLKYMEAGCDENTKLKQLI